MAITVDQLITRYIAKDEYSGTVAKIVTASLSAATAISALTAAGVGVTKFALDAATEFDTFTRRLEALTGSTAKAQELVKWLKQLSGPSVFEFRGLAEAASLLAAYGVNIQRVLPLAERIATVFGDDSSAVSEVARALGRIKSGDFGEAFERLRDFGIGRDDLKAQGLKFDKGGQFLGSARQAFEAIERLVNQKFGRITQAMRDSPAAKMASVMDALRQAAGAAGAEILRSIVPALEKVASFLQYLNESGFIKDFTRNLSQGMEDLANLVTGGQGGVVRVISYLLAFLEQLPTLLKLAITHLRGFLATLGDMFSSAVNGIIKAINALIGAAEIVGNLLNPLRPFRDRTRFQRIEEMTPFSQQMANLDTSLFNGTFSDIGKRADQIMAGFNAFGKRPDEEPGANTDPFFTGAGDSLNKIEEHTRKTADYTKSMLDLRRYVVGGGPLADIGVTPVELGGARAARNVTVNMSGVGREAEAFVESVAQKVVFELARSGMLRGAAGR